MKGSPRLREETRSAWSGRVFVGIGRALYTGRTRLKTWPAGRLHEPTQAAYDVESLRYRLAANTR
jgi:hypothetical protein